MYKALEVWSQNRGACPIFEFAWHVSAFVGVMAPDLGGPMCLAPSLCQRYSVLFDLWHMWMRLLVNPSGMRSATSWGGKAAIWSVALCLVSLGLFGLYIILRLCTFAVLQWKNSWIENFIACTFVYP